MRGKLTMLLLLALALLLAASPALAAEPAAMSGVVIGGDGVITWSAWPGADSYLLEIDDTGQYGESGVNLITILEELLASESIRNTPTHLIAVAALNSMTDEVLARWSGTYSYLSPNYPEYTVAPTLLKDSAKLDPATGILSWAARSTDTTRYSYSVSCEAGGVKSSIGNSTTGLSVDINKYIDDRVTDFELAFAAQYTVELIAQNAAGEALETWTLPNYSHTPVVSLIDVNDETFGCNGIADGGYPATGAAIRPTISDVAIRSRALTEGVDYAVSYGENIAVGEGQVFVTGIGRYTGVRTLTFAIRAAGTTPEPPPPTDPASEGAPTTPAEPAAPADPTLPADLSRCAIGVADQAYTGKALTPVPSVSWNGVALAPGVDFRVTGYRNNKDIGAASVTLEGMGGVTGSATVSFNIVPKPTKLSKLSAGKKKLTAKWKKAKKIDGYQLEYSLNKDFSDSGFAEVKGAKKTSKAIKKLKSKKKYYVRVRTYKVVDGRTYYSAWSKAKSVKVK